MKVSDETVLRAGARIRRIAFSLLIALLTLAPVGLARADEPPPVATPTGEALTTWAMHWFAQMMAGRTDRSQYAAGFVAQVTDEAGARRSHHLHRHRGAPAPPAIGGT